MHPLLRKQMIHSLLS